ncbi:hypothetical protein [Flavobacterium sp.]|uniref:gliding motility protein GldB-related protein n=1 Tax=Flavobacterium sp. TaxID=239 RepID=UPI0026120D4A|nr:hypothetical protein [Flavobacterium sp.]
MKLKFTILFFIFSSIVYGQKFYTSDIDNFYQAFDLACNDTTNAQKIFDKYYFKKGTKGLDDFYKFKIKDKEKFSEKVIKGKEFYASIRQELKNVSKFEDSIIKNYNRFTEVYPKAEFGDIYFVVGRLSSNGTISKNGLIIGTEYLSKTESNSKNWNSSMLNNIFDFNHIPITVFHEMIHFNQNGMVRENNLLSYALREGSAEFLTELFTGKTDGDYKAFQNREVVIWEDFKKEMYQDKSISWRDENEPLRPRNALYWAGYLICKSYYENLNDKQQAVYDILNVKNNLDFYKKSKVEDYIIKHFK